MVSVHSYEPAAHNSLLRVANDLRRGEYFGGLYILGCANGFASRVVHSVGEIGWSDALYGTFGVSVIVLASCVAGISLILRDQSRGVRPLEIAVGAGFIILVILPIGALSWIAVTQSAFSFSYPNIVLHLDGARLSCSPPPFRCSGVECCFNFLPTSSCQQMLR